MATESEPNEAAVEAEPKSGQPSAAAPEELIVLPVRDAVLMPGAIMPIVIGREISIAAAQQAVREERQIGLLMQRDPKLAEPTALDLHRTGTVASILRYMNAPDGAHHVVLQGEQRFRATDFVKARPVIVARVERFAEPDSLTPEIEARFRFLQQEALEAFRLMPQTPKELIDAVEAIPTPGALADMVAMYLDISADTRQDLLETFDIATRIDKVTKLLDERLHVLRLTQEIGQQTKAAFDERQREAILREQMAAIQRQLGEGDTRGEEAREIGEKIAKAGMPPEVET